ncbi:MAG: hypothetical protein M1831_004126 [Alyxoria varia]|nr:MAG: hypothetical protein M1831_004126 [Alyxoria varia]
MRVTTTTVTALVAFSSAASTTLAAPVSETTNDNTEVATTVTDVDVDNTSEVPLEARGAEAKKPNPNNQMSSKQKKAWKVSKKGLNKDLDKQLKDGEVKSNSPSASHEMEDYAYARKNTLNKAYGIFPDQRFKDKALWYEQRYKTLYGTKPDDGKDQCTVM